MFGRRMVAGFEAVKDRFDPDGILNPGRIVRPPRMDDRTLFRYPPVYRREPMDTRLDWSGWPAGLHGAVEMCNNNGACRKLAGGVMCPSYRVTRNERDVTRGRANTLRLALTGQLGPDALTSDEMAETLKLCVSCKACKRECPMSIDMAAMKIEVAAARAARHGLSLRDRLVAHLPRYAPWAARARGSPTCATGCPARRVCRNASRASPPAASCRQWSRRPFRENAGDDNPHVILFADTFNRWFEPDHLRDAVAVLRAAGFRVGFAQPPGERSLCCGRTYLSAGLVDLARAEMARSVAAFRPDLDRGAAIVGLEPSCLLTFRDEAPRLLPDWGEATAVASCCWRSSLPDTSTASRSARWRAEPGSTATVTRKPPTSWVPSPASSPPSRSWSSTRSRPPAAGWLAPSATRPKRPGPPARWASSRCCPPCARRARKTGSLPTAPRAGTR